MLLPISLLLLIQLLPALVSAFDVENIASNCSGITYTLVLESDELSSAAWAVQISFNGISDSSSDLRYFEIAEFFTADALTQDLYTPFENVQTSSSASSSPSFQVELIDRNGHIIGYPPTGAADQEAFPFSLDCYGQASSTTTRTSTYQPSTFTSQRGTTATTTSSSVSPTSTSPSGSALQGSFCIYATFTESAVLREAGAGPYGFGSDQCSGTSCTFNNAPSGWTNGQVTCDGGARISGSNELFTGFGPTDVLSVYVCACGQSIYAAAEQNSVGTISADLCPNVCYYDFSTATSDLSCSYNSACSYGYTAGDPGNSTNANCISAQYADKNVSSSAIATLAKNEDQLNIYRCDGTSHQSSGCLLGDSFSEFTYTCSCSSNNKCSASSSSSHSSTTSTTTTTYHGSTPTQTNAAGSVMAPSGIQWDTLCPPFALVATFLALFV